ncbi:MAG: hypothetical protein JXB15_18030 [Anaerolineales bacterium]|nr:hypothetical protein [Anaerolineales bacterium]
MKKVISVFFISMLVVLSISTPVQADSLIVASDDTYIDLNHPTTNYDGSALLVGNSNFPTCVQTRLSYLRFDVSSLTSDVGTATPVSVWISSAAIYSGDLGIWSTTHDDWNGGTAGNGSEADLNWNNAPPLASQLDTESVTAGVGGIWVHFASTNLANYINAQRSANGGDNLATFVIQWTGCAVGSFINSIEFEDHEGTKGTGYLPRIEPNYPTAVYVSGFYAEPKAGSIDLSWRTTTGVGIYACNLYRASEPSGEKIQLNSAPIEPDDPPPLVDPSYFFPDFTAIPGETYFYWVEPLSGTQVLPMEGPVSAMGLNPMYLAVIAR